MKIRELIEHLQEIEKQSGNVEVYLNNETAPQDVPGDIANFLVVPEDQKNDLGLSERVVSIRAWLY